MTGGVGLLSSMLAGGGETTIGDVSRPWRWSGEVDSGTLLISASTLILALALALVFFSIARDKRKEMKELRMEQKG